MADQNGYTNSIQKPDTQNKQTMGGDKEEVTTNLVGIKNPSKQIEVEAQTDRNYPSCSIINVVKTVATYLAFFGAGMGNSLYGTTILHLQDKTMSTPNQIATIFTWRALGSMFGNLLVAVLFDKIHPEIILCIGGLFLAAFTVAVPMCSSFTVLVVVIAINGFSHGILGGGCNSYILKTWRLKSPPFLQALHFITSFGSCISPLIVDIFVEDIHQTSHNSSEIIDSIENNDTLFYVQQGNVQNSSNYLNSTNEVSSANAVILYSSELLYPFLITAICITIASVSYAGAFIMGLIQFKRKTLSKSDSFLNHQKEDHTKITQKGKLVLIMIFLVIYGGMECTYGSWIVAFCVKYLETPFETAAFICTSYWGSLAGGRAISIVTTKIFSPAFLVCVCLVLSFIALAVMTVACTLHIAVTWVGSILVGVSFAPIFGNCISYCQREFNISSRVTSIFMFCLYIGFMGMPALVGVLFVKFTPMCFYYVLTSGSIVITCIFFAIVIHKRFCL